jgi:hypothetical protein
MQRNASCNVRAFVGVKTAASDEEATTLLQRIQGGGRQG